MRRQQEPPAGGALADVHLLVEIFVQRFEVGVVSAVPSPSVVEPQRLALRPVGASERGRRPAKGVEFAFSPQVIVRSHALKSPSIQSPPDRLEAARFARRRLWASEIRPADILLGGAFPLVCGLVWSPESRICEFSCPRLTPEAGNPGDFDYCQPNRSLIWASQAP